MTGWGRLWKSDAALCHSSGPTCSCTWSHQQYVSLMLKRQSGEQQAGGVLRAWILNSESQQRKPGLFTDTASCSSVAHIKTQVIFWPGSDWAVRPLEALHRCRPLTKITIRQLPAQLHGNPTSNTRSKKNVEDSGNWVKYSPTASPTKLQSHLSAVRPASLYRLSYPVSDLESCPATRTGSTGSHSPWSFFTLVFQYPPQQQQPSNLSHTSSTQKTLHL